MTPRRAAATLFAVALAAGLPASAAGSSAVGPARSVLTGGGPDMSVVPVTQPYLLAWSADLARRQLALRFATETGGLTADPRSGWVYVATRDGRVVCLVDGRIRWTTEVGTSLLAAPVVFREDVYVGSADGVLSVLNKVTGERRSRTIVGEELSVAPVVVDTPEGVRVYQGTTADSVFAIDPKVGAKLWRAHRDLPTGFTITGFARPVVADGVVYVGFADGFVEALDQQTGVPRWERQVSPSGPGAGTPSGTMTDIGALGFDGKRLYVASYSGGVYALEPASGATVWRTPLNGAARLTASGNRLFAAAPGQLVALDPVNGTETWRFEYPAQSIVGTPLAVSNLVLAQQSEGPLYMLDRNTGAPVGQFATGEGLSVLPAVNGRAVYVLSNGGRVYALGVTQ